MPCDHEVDAIIEFFGQLSFAEIQLVFKCGTRESARLEVLRACKKAKSILRRRLGRELTDHEITHWMDKV
jgi:hypothetical protein